MQRKKEKNAYLFNQMQDDAEEKNITFDFEGGRAWMSRYWKSR